MNTGTCEFSYLLHLNEYKLSSMMGENETKKNKSKKLPQKNGFFSILLELYSLPNGSSSANFEQEKENTCTHFLILDFDRR